MKDAVRCNILQWLIWTRRMGNESFCPAWREAGCGCKPTTGPSNQALGGFLHERLIFVSSCCPSEVRASFGRVPSPLLHCGPQCCLNGTSLLNELRKFPWTVAEPGFDCDHAATLPNLLKPGYTCRWLIIARICGSPLKLSGRETLRMSQKALRSAWLTFSVVGFL